MGRSIRPPGSVRSRFRVWHRATRTSTSTQDAQPYGLIDWAPVLLYVNCSREPFSNPAVRRALSHFLNRQELLERGLGGAGIVTSLPIPSLATLAATIEATSELLAQYPVTTFDPNEGGRLLTEAGWSNEGDAWTKDGQPLTIEIEGDEEFSDLGAVVAEQLSRPGIGATFSVAFDL